MKVYELNGACLGNEVKIVGEMLEGSDPLSILPLAVGVDKGPPYKVSPNWVVERVKDFYHVVGLSCNGFEGKMLALFAKIEATRDQSLAGNVSQVHFTSGIKGNRELKRQDCSVNYDKNGGQSTRGREKGRGSNRVL